MLLLHKTLFERYVINGYRISGDEVSDELITSLKECKNYHGYNLAIIEPANPIHNPVY